MRRVGLFALLVFLADQASKLGVLFGLGLIERGEIDVLPPYLNLRMAWNTGVNFGILSGGAEIMRWVLIALALAISAWVWRWISKGQHGEWAQISAGLLIGGALGNVVDRIVHGAVADFLNMSCCGFENPYAFNIADVAIFAGAIGLVFFAGEDADHKPRGRKTP